MPRHILPNATADQHDVGEYDDFDAFLDESLQNPEFAAAFEDAEQRSRLISDLTSCRKGHKLRQKDIAAHMGVAQSVVSDFERRESDVYFSTLQRYARACGARLAVRIEMPAEQTWAKIESQYDQRAAGRTEVVVKAPASVWLRDWAAERAGAEQHGLISA
jgi:transcriptional regulator with XRE-family HTH domain